MSGKHALQPEELQRLDELSERFRSVAKRRHKLEPETRKILLERAALDLSVFAVRLVQRYGSDSFPTVQKIADFLRNPMNGAPKYIDIALCPQPPEKRVPFVPAEYIKRHCAAEAKNISQQALASFE